MDGPQPRLWPAQERVLSPVAGLLLGALATLSVVALARGDLRLLALGLGALGAVIADRRFFEVAWLARLDERYATSGLLQRRLHRRSRRRVLVRRLLPVVSATARTSALLLTATLIGLLGGALAGLAIPGLLPPTVIAIAGVVTRTLSYVGMTSVAFVLMARPYVRDWDQGVQSALCETAVLSGKQLSARLEHDGAITLARLLGLLSLAILVAVAVFG